MESNFDFESTIDGMANSSNQHQTVVSMQQLLNNPSPSLQNQHMQWSASTQGQDLSAMQLTHDSRHPHHPHARHPATHGPKPAQAFQPPQPMHPNELHQEHRQQHLPALESKPLIPQSANAFHLDDNPPIEPHVATQMGGLAYADLCKERAREMFKEMKKNEHMARGEFDRMKRRKKGDTSMTPREKYVRRLKMNQDSAAAARHAQEVYVHVLEKLVKTFEEEKKAILAENDLLRQQKGSLQDKVTRMEHEEGPMDAQGFLDAPEKYKKYDPLQLAKMIDMLTAPETVSAQANDPDFAAGKMGIQPAPAV